MSVTGRAVRNEFFGRYHAAGQVRSGTGWVVLVTDSRVREGNTHCHTYWCALGKLPAPSEGEFAVSDRAWKDYLAAVAGADDVRRARAESRLDASEPVPAEVRWQGKTIGFRHEARPRLHPGQIVWAVANRSTREITGIALAAVWRHVGEHPVGERVPSQLLPCADPSELCPSCRVFGSADTQEAGSLEARQRSYRGHVRFSDARPLDSATSTSPVRLAPLGAPRPGAGQFYLDNEGHRKPPKRGDRPLREWGSPADQGERPRRLRGRKQYWLTERHAERPFFRASKGTWTGEMAGDAEQVDAGARFTFRVQFDGLSLAELGGLLVSLDPSQLFDRASQAVGGGKPLGFGTCAARISALEVTDAAARYTGAPPPQVSVEEAVAAFEDEVLPEVRATWRAVEAALTVDRVEPGTVWYPPKNALPESGALHVDDLVAGFDFWKNSVGEELKRSTRPLISLPRVTASNQALPVRPDAQENDPGKRKQNKGKKGKQQ